MIRFILCIAFFSFSKANAQISKVTLQASGLTCSMCSNAINKSLSKVSYVTSVKANIKESSFDLTFTPNSIVNFDELKNKVEDAGFFVSTMTAEADLSTGKRMAVNKVQLPGMVIQFLKGMPATLSTKQTFTLVNKGFVSNKMFKQYSKLYAKEFSTEELVQQKDVRLYRVMM